MSAIADVSAEEKISRPYVTVRRPKKDKPASMIMAALIHAAVMAVAGASFIKPPEFGVDEGIGSIEVNLIAAPSEVVPQPAPVETPVEPKPDSVEQVIVKPVPKVVEKTVEAVETTGKDEVTVQSTGGAISEAKPDYLKNPAPVYPESARRRGHEGTVLLMVDVDKEGQPVSVTVKKSSGHSVLDDVALKAVKKWKFRPGKVGSMPIESTVRVPITFNLKKWTTSF